MRNRQVICAALLIILSAVSCTPGTPTTDASMVRTDAAIAELRVSSAKYRRLVEDVMNKQTEALKLALDYIKKLEANQCKK